MKEIFIDTETTGLYPWKHSIIQISGLMYEDGEFIREFDIKMKPFKGADIKVNKELIKAGHLTYERGFEKFRDIVDTFVDKFDKKDKAFIIGYNIDFDINMLRNMFKRNKYNYFGSYFFTPGIDTMQFAIKHLMKDRVDMKDFKLGTVAKQLGIKVVDDNLHDGLYDIKLTKKVHDIVF